MGYKTLRCPPRELHARPPRRTCSHLSASPSSVVPRTRCWRIGYVDGSVRAVHRRAEIEKRSHYYMERLDAVLPTHRTPPTTSYTSVMTSLSSHSSYPILPLIPYHTSYHVLHWIVHPSYPTSSIHTHPTPSYLSLPHPTSSYPVSPLLHWILLSTILLYQRVPQPLLYPTAIPCGCG